GALEQDARMLRRLPRGRRQHVEQRRVRVRLGRGGHAGGGAREPGARAEGALHASEATTSSSSTAAGGVCGRAGRPRAQPAGAGGGRSRLARVSACLPKRFATASRTWSAGEGGSWKISSCAATPKPEA